MGEQTQAVYSSFLSRRPVVVRLHLHPDKLQREWELAGGVRRWCLLSRPPAPHPHPLCGLSIPRPSHPLREAGNPLGSPWPVSGVWLADPQGPAWRPAPPNLEVSLKWSCGEEMLLDLEASRAEPDCSGPAFRSPPAPHLFFMEVINLLLKHNILVLSFLICSRECPKPFQTPGPGA